MKRCLIMGCAMLGMAGKANARTQNWAPVALLLGLAVATSIDALAVGFTMGNLDARRWAYAGTIGITAALMTLLGMLIGHHGSRHLGEWAERAGALLMLAVAVKMLVM